MLSRLSARKRGLLQPTLSFWHASMCHREAQHLCSLTQFATLNQFMPWRSCEPPRNTSPHLSRFIFDLLLFLGGNCAISQWIGVIPYRFRQSTPPKGRSQCIIATQLRKKRRWHNDIIWVEGNIYHCSSAVRTLLTPSYRSWGPLFSHLYWPQRLLLAPSNRPQGLPLTLSLATEAAPCSLLSAWKAITVTEAESLSFVKTHCSPIPLSSGCICSTMVPLCSTLVVPSFLCCCGPLLHLVFSTP